MRRLLIPAFAAVLTVAAMLYQAKTVAPVLCEPPTVVLPEVPGFAAEVLEPSEAELHVLPSDTRFDKRRYVAEDGTWFLVTVVIGGHSKSSIHRPELCLPSQGFQMREPQTVRADGAEWHLVTLERKDAASLGFAYTFFNQDGFRTSSHLKRIFRDIWDRSVLGRIDRWVMVTVNSSESDEKALVKFLTQLKKDGSL